jgi:hypothetical protein
VFLESSSIFHADPILSTDGVVYGEGVEREVMMTIFTRFTASEAQWFERGEDNNLILGIPFAVNFQCESNEPILRGNGWELSSGQLFS